MMHAENNKKGYSDLLPSLLKPFSMFKMSIWYERNNVQKIFPDDLGIKCIKCDKVIGCILNNWPIGDFISVFVTNVVFHHVGLSWITKFKSASSLILRSTVLIGSLMVHCIPLLFDHYFMVCPLNIMLQLHWKERFSLMCSV